MTRRITALAAALVVLAALVVAGCGSSSGSTDGSTTSGTTATGSATAATVKTASAGGLGTILVDAQGRTLYLFQRDTGPTSTCDGACLAQWPAATTHGKPQAGGGATASMLGTTKRADGTTQVTYAGHPLYYYAGDAAAGDANGQGIDAYGAKWYVVGTDGAAITAQAGGDGSSGSSTSGGGYGY